jgi:hypothetical protein
MRHLFSPWNKKMEYPTEEAVKKIDIESAQDLLEYFQDFDFAEERGYSYEEEDGEVINDSMGSVGINFWFCDKNGVSLGNIGNLEGGRIRPWFYTHTETAEGAVIGYRVWIQANDRHPDRIPDEIINELRERIKLVESSLNFDFYSIQIKNYNWDKYKTSDICSRNFEDIKKYEGDFVSLAIVFTLNNK